MRYRTVCLALILLGCAVTRGFPNAASGQQLEFTGGTIIAPGYRIVQDRNTDTSVATGVIKNFRKGLGIQYSIFTNGFVFAEPKERKMTGQKVLWSRRDRGPRGARITTLVEDADGEKILYISLAEAGPANFVAKISGDSNRAGVEIAVVEKIVGTFRPRQRR